MDIMFHSSFHPGCRVIRKGDEIHIVNEGVYHYYFDNIPRGCLIGVHPFEYIPCSIGNTDALGVIIHKLKPI